MNISPIEQMDLPVLEALINSAYRGSEKGVEGAIQGWTNENGFVGEPRIDLNHSKELQTSDTISILKLEEDGIILGCVRLEQLGNNVAEMSALSVRPDGQNKGVGSKLIQASEDWARNRGCSAIKITVISGRTTLIDYYKRRNFQETGETSEFHQRPGSGLPAEGLTLKVFQKQLK